MGRRALVLFAHGARSASWAAPFERLRDMVKARAEADVEVALAFLELMSPSLPDQVAALAARGVDDVTVVPVFLGQGGHVLRDLPQILDGMRLAHPAMAIRTVGAVGEDPTVLRAMTDYCLSSLPLA